jgi:benzoyl-CoA reductase/2-hydroxyglutaryl-CoA dehydratase subunit BcrC/BadD/HgdB
LVIPLACDWAARFPAILSQYGIELPDPFCFLEPPRLREAGDGRERWRAEIGRLAAFLEKLAGRPLAAARLRDSLALYRRAWGALERLTEKRRRGEVPGVWFFLIANSFLRGDPESWLAALEEALPGFGEPPARDAPRIFLAGSPIFFPDFKLPELLEEAGFALVADDLCSSERIFPGAAFYRDPSLPGMLQALAERHHQGSGCPVFADDRNRPASILGQAKHFEGVVFHILKGCHPYDMDSRGVEAALGKRGIPFLRLETDLAPGDRENLLVRLEAFRAILQRGRRGRSGRA